jgi:hypothetical protein
MTIVGLEPEMTYRVRTTDPVDPAEGPRQYWQVSEATRVPTRAGTSFW